jgi:hypothetical protein
MALNGILKKQDIRLVFAQVMEDVRTRRRYQLSQLVGEDAFYVTLDDVVNACLQQPGQGDP